MAIIIIPTIRGFVIGAPILFSPKKAIEEALREVGAKEGEKFYDLGSGTGRTMIIAAKKVLFYQINKPLIHASSQNGN